MAVPQKLIEQGLEKAVSTTIYGVLINEMTREELIACCVIGWSALERQMEEHQRRFDLMAKRK